VDLDADGQRDVITGSWPGELYWFRGESGGKFAAAEQIKGYDIDPDESIFSKLFKKKGEDKPTILRVGNASAVFAADWDRDGDLDLLVGNISGQVYLAANEGSPQKPSFARPVALSADDKEIKVPHGDAGPAVADWDGDGKQDLVVGAGDGSVVWYPNTGTAEKPVLGAAKTLVAASPSSDYGDLEKRAAASKTPAPGSRAKICVTDYDGDGKLDLLLGDFNSTVIKQRDLTSEEKELATKARENYSRVIKEYVKAVSDATSSGDKADEIKKKQQQAIEKLTEAQKEMAQYEQYRHEHHGYVWFFKRTAAIEKTARADK
jgi:hypothetical protein